MRGAPKLLSITTLRPLGPRVTFTASARVSTPLRMRSRASRLNLTSLAAIYASFRFRRKLRNFTLKSGFRRSEEHTSELQSLMRNSYAVFCLKKKKKKNLTLEHEHTHEKQT